MTRTLTFGIALIALALFTRDVVEPVRATPQHVQESREKQCRFQWMDGGTWSEREERRTAVCVVDKFGVVGGLDQLLAVGDCESGWYRFASNGGRYLGLFQHAASSWPGRVRAFMPDGWKVGPWERWANSRAQIVTTVRMVNASGGWSAWSCA